MTSGFSLNPVSNRARRGFSLAEFSIVLGIMGVVLGALWGVVAIVRENVKRGEMAEQTVAMVNNIRSFYMGQMRLATPAGSVAESAVTDHLLRQGILLSEQLRDRTAGTWVADHPWGATGASGAVLANGGIGVSGVDAGGVDVSTHSFRIQLRGLKYSSCVALASRLSGSNPTGLRTVHINGTPTSPVTPDVAAANCNTAPAGTANTLDFLYSLRDQR